MSIVSLIDQEEFYHFYQPIYDLKNSVKIGYEVLLRSEHYPNPEYAFQEAKKEKQLYELDSWSIHKAAVSYQVAGFTKKDGYLFLNVFPSTLSNPKFPSFINQIMTDKQLHSQQIVLEITESEEILSYKNLKEIVSQLKRRGILIAIDDVGKGQYSLQSIIELEPHFIKLDRYFAKNLNQYEKKQTFISLTLNYCEQYNTKLILEGLEHKADVALAKKLGVPFVQGYVLGKPSLLKNYMR